MKIAEVAPLYESVPPKTYGGTERIVSYLTEKLVAMGHEVTLFASGDSETNARLIPGCSRSLRSNEKCIDKLAYHLGMLDDVMREASEFDIIHFHIDYLHFPLSRCCGLPSVTTLHGRLDLPDLIPLYQRFRGIPLISISFAQRNPLPGINWIGNVYHGLPADLYSFHQKQGNYLAFLGRISPEKRVDRAIEIALRSGMHLKIAAKIDPVDREYYESQIKPLLHQPCIEFIGEITEKQKSDFLGNAYAYLFPIDWPEPFGLTMIEAMACGTPTIAFNCGSVPEVMVDGVTGFVVSDLEGAVKAVQETVSLDRAACRSSYEQRFTDSRMAEQYLELYETVGETCPGHLTTADENPKP
jgi:glycosyltransferase involved in cell wall biosynthesis